MSLFNENKHNAGPAREQTRSGRAVQERRDDQDLMVLEDMDNGKEYYLYKLDSFVLYGKTYVCMASYEPETGSHTEPQLVIMRLKEDKRKKDDHQQYFESVRDQKELDAVFDAFYARMEKGLQN